MPGWGVGGGRVRVWIEGQSWARRKQFKLFSLKKPMDSFQRAPELMDQVGARLSFRLGVCLKQALSVLP